MAHFFRFQFFIFFLVNLEKIHVFLGYSSQIISFTFIIASLILNFTTSFDIKSYVWMEGKDSGTNPELGGEGAGSSRQPSSSPGGLDPNNKDSSNLGGVKPGEKQEYEDERRKNFDASKLTGGRADNGEMHLGVFDPNEEVMPCHCCEAEPCSCGGPQPANAPVQEWIRDTRPYCFDAENSAGAKNINYPCCNCGDPGYSYVCSSCGCTYCRDCHSNHG